MKDYLIEIKGLSKRYGSAKQTQHDALKHIDLTIPRGVIYGIIGMSGAGKSTLLRCLTGLESPSQGTITIEGRDLTQKSAKELRQIRQHIGMVFQHFQLFSSRTVAENITYPLEIHGASLTEQQQRVDELLALIELPHKKHVYPSQLSGGEKQRVGIARALANHPQLLLCDEPTSALDPKTTRSLLQFLAKLNQQLNLTIVIITHDLDTVKQICQRVAVLSHGELVEEGEVKDIFTRPQHPATRHLLHLDACQIPSDLLQQRSSTKQFVRLSFEGNQAKAPILSHMLKRYDVEANILSGGLDYLQQTIVGNLFIELEGRSETIEQALAFLRSQHVICEVIHE